MISFDLSSVPSEATIKSSILELYHEDFSTSSFISRNFPKTFNKPATMSIYRVNKFWSEKMYLPATSYWASYNTSYVSPALDEFRYDSSTTKSTFDVTSAVADMVSGSVDNYGFMVSVYVPSVHPYTESSGTWTSWFSSEYWTTSMRPKLIIEYTNGAVTTYMLTVNSGSGDGDYAEGDSISITADTALTGKEFDKWIGNTSYLLDPNSSTTTVTMPSQDIAVTATYKYNTSVKFNSTVFASDVSVKSISKSNLIIGNARKGLSEISIFNITGKNVYSISKDLSIDGLLNFENIMLSNGSYIVQIKDDTGYRVSRHIVN